MTLNLDRKAGPLVTPKNPSMAGTAGLNLSDSVYERLLEFDLAEEDGSIVARPQTFARKTSGSYYTPEDLVMLVIRRTVAPLLEERRTAFGEASERLSDVGTSRSWIPVYAVT